MKEEIIKNNILIAEFIHRRGKVRKDLFYFYDKRTGKAWHTDKELQFNSSWDWIMPVVEKIESLGYRVEIFNNRCVVSYNGEHNDFPSNPNIDVNAFDDKMVAVYNAVIKFINWHVLHISQ